jgi:hypothetical protein
MSASFRRARESTTRTLSEMADDTLPETSPLQSPPVHSNWKAALEGGASKSVYEFALYADAQTSGGITEGRITERERRAARSPLRRSGGPAASSLYPFEWDALKVAVEPRREPLPTEAS